MWKALLGATIKEIVLEVLKEKMGSPKDQDAAKSLAYQQADKTLADIQALVKTAPDKAVAALDTARASLKLVMGQ